MVILPDIRRFEKSAGFGLNGFLTLTEVALGRRDALCPAQVFVSVSSTGTSLTVVILSQDSCTTDQHKKT